MAKYTTLLRSICESVSGLTESAGNDDTDSVIATARPLIFNFTYPVIANVTPKEELETKILRHYYFREIGFETYGQWKFYLQTRMNEIMPYYNQLYQSAVDMAEFNPFEDVNYERKIEKRGDDKLKNSGTDTISRRNERNGNETNTRTYDDYEVERVPNLNNTRLYSDTPQGSISRMDVDNNAYLTNATINKDTGKETTTTNGTITDEKVTTGLTDVGQDTTTHGKIATTEFNSDVTETVKGKMGNAQYAEVLEKLRKTFINIDMRIINDLSDLFMNIY